MMDFYLNNVTSLPDPRENETALAGIPDWRREYIVRYMRPGDRKLSLGVWRLLEETLHRKGFSISDVTIGKNGKLECEGVYFNLSHSADMVLCAISDTPVGCDIEKVTDAPMEVAEHVFSRKERQYIADAENEGEMNRRFFRLWTMKESYVKMTGEGMSLSPKCVEIELETLTIQRDSMIQSCTLQNTAYDGYEVSICQSEIRS